MVGQTIELGANQRFRVRSLLAEGGYALVFAVQAEEGSASTGGGGGRWYALKRQLAVDRAAAEAVVREINFLKEVLHSYIHSTSFFSTFLFVKIKLAMVCICNMPARASD